MIPTLDSCVPAGPALACRVDRRRYDVRAKGSNGIDDIEVAEPDAVDHSVTLCVHFLGRVPEDVTAANVRIDGGVRIRGIKATSATPRRAVAEDEDDCLEVRLDRAGDASVYAFCLVEAHRGRPGREPFHGLDPHYHCRSFVFTGHCASDSDCAAGTSCPPDRRPDPPIDYLAKDYASFRRLILDRMALLVPGWRDRHVPDVGVTLIELLAYVGDQLSYYQDAVATEAYLDTARRRISVRRHGRLVDYLLHEGCNARAFVAVHVTHDVEWPTRSVVFLTGYPGAPPRGGPALSWADLPEAARDGYRCFEPAGHGEILRLWEAHNEIQFHTWGNRECCLPAGATTASLVDGVGKEGGGRLRLCAGDVLLFEEVIGPHTGFAADADPARRHAVRLTHVEKPAYDEVEGVWVCEILWDRDDALPFPFCLSSLAPAPDCRPLCGVSVARGNVVLVDNGLRVEELLPPVPEAERSLVCEGECRPAEYAPRPGRYRPGLERPGLTFAEPVPQADACGHRPSAAALMSREARSALPAARLSATPPEALRHLKDAEELWEPRFDLLGSGPDDRHFVVEVDDQRRSWLRFGDDRLGEGPDAGTAFRASYRVGNGPAGNAGAEMIRQVALRDATDDTVVWVRNPLPATGGTAPESIREAKLAMPFAFRSRRERAVTGADYAELAERAGGRLIQRAAGELVWTGSWYEAEVAIDPHPGATSPAGCAFGGGGCGDCGECADGQGLGSVVVAALEQARRMGHDLRVEMAAPVAVDLAITVCVKSHEIQSHVKAALYEAFSDRVLASGTLGFFHPDRWTFGDNLYVSQVIAAAQAVPGVESAEVTRLKRQGEVDRDERKAGVLKVGRNEVIVLAGDLVRVHVGRLEISARGGR